MATGIEVFLCVTLYAEVFKRFFHQLLILIQTHLQSLMERQGCIYLIHARMHSECGLPVTGLQDKIKLVPIDLKNRPAWYKQKVYPANKVPALEHNNEVKGESLDLIKILPRKSLQKSCSPTLTRSTKQRLLHSKEMGAKLTAPGVAFDYIETALSKFEDGPFFLGQFTLVDIAYAPFIERLHPFLLEVKKCDITLGRPKLATWIEEMNKNEAYKQTKSDPKELVQSYKERFMAQL